MSDQETKIGQSKSYEIGRRTLTLKPLPLGKMKRATMIFLEKTTDNMELIVRYLFAMFDNGDNKDLSIEWIQENMTLPQAQQIVDDSRIINGLGNFFQKGEAAPQEPQPKTPEERAINELTPIHSA